MNMKKRFSLFILVFLALSATWATRNTFEGLPPTVCMDMPEGFTITQSSGSNSFQLKNKYCPVSAIVQIVPSKGKSAEEFSGEKLKSLGTETQSSAYQWRERTVCLSTVEGSIGGESSRGYALSVPYGNKMIFLMVWCQAQSADTYENFMASFIDALYVDSESFFQTGPFTQFLYPPSGKRKAVSLTVGGKKIQSFMDTEDEEASEYLIEREHSVVKFYGQVPEWKEAWMRYYRIIFRDSCGRLMQISYDLGQALAPDSKDHTELAQKILTWTQEFKYGRNTGKADFTSLPQVLCGKASDCDSRSMLIAVILQSLGFDSIIFVSPVHSHAIAGLVSDHPGFGFESEGKMYLTGETTVKNLTWGLLNKDQADPSKWFSVALP